MKQIVITDSTMAEAIAQIDALESLSIKDQGCLRLLTEEMFSMVVNVLDVDRLNFKIRKENNTFTLSVDTETRIGDEEKQQFLSLSSKGENAASKGIKGLLASIIEVCTYADDPDAYMPVSTYPMHVMDQDYSCMWSLSQYMEYTPKEKVVNEWDGIEKSIIANFADDVVIGVRSGRLEMTVTKTLAAGNKQ